MSAPRMPQENAPLTLAPAEAPAGHDFADPAHYEGDLALLNYLLQDLRVLARRAAAGHSVPGAYESLEWEVHGLARRTVLCDIAALIEPTDRQIVGFFGDRRSDTGSCDIDGAELDVVGQFPQHRGIISYSSVELLDDQWANLVVHESPDDRQRWRQSAVHIDAAELLAPRIYHSVRIHNGSIRGGPASSNTIELETTKYWDYDADPVWHATRRLAPNASSTPNQAESA